ncbi:hypothetical protein M3196_15095 [Fictibacillus nanhaiensis]|uniref:hypothetical protein n=1 Tax=Fictibacillus nanhaiensis TaxID=742169 RepID=UPI0020420450|nr:hypothetical protein [Fictibacillus nanhaiensis]MCM3732979.1 hypothetical protein [Fictibacillus nanhaiensis]
MIASLIKKNVDRFTSRNVWFVCLVFSLYSIHLKGEAASKNISYWEYFILSLTDHYYILYFMILSFLFLIFNIFRQNEETVWIRSGTYFKYFISNIISLLVISTIFVFFHVLITSIFGFGLSLENTYTDISMDERFTIKLFVPYFSNPFFASVSIILYMISGFTFLGVIFLFFKQFFNEILVIVSLVFLYILMLLSIRSDLDLTYPYIFFNDYIILHHAFVVLESQHYRLFIVELLAISIILIVIKKYWSRKIYLHLKKPALNFFDKWTLSVLLSRKNLIFIISLSLFTVLTTVLRSNNITTFFDLLFFQFSGHGTGYFYYLDFLRMIVYNGVPLYFLCYFLEKESTERSSLILIRIRHKTFWLMSLIRSALIFISIYVITTIVVTLSISLISGLSFDGYDYVLKDLKIGNVNPLLSVFIMLSTKILELFVCFLCIFLLYCYTKTITFGFLAIGFTYVLCIFNTPIVKYLPFGMSSLTRIQEFIGKSGVPYLISITVLLTSCLVIYTIIRNGAFQRIYK